MRQELESIQLQINWMFLMLLIVNVTLIPRFTKFISIPLGSNFILRDDLQYVFTNS